MRTDATDGGAGPEELVVRVPCSTSNLGSGFDTIGLALDRYLEVRFVPRTGGDSGLRLERRGTLATLELPAYEDLAVRAFRAVEEEVGRRAPGTLVLHSEIPLARGLGSSAAALVAGHAAARLALGLPPDPHASFRHAAAVEGHGDNAAPCAWGGLVGVVRTDAGPRVVPLELSPEVGFAYAAPGVTISTRAARAVLPEQVEHRAAVEELGHLVALLRGLATADGELVRLGVRDHLHVPHRLRLIPGAPEAIRAAYATGAWGVTISGAGSGLLAIAAPGDAAAIASAMKSAFSLGEETRAIGWALRPDRDGLRSGDG